MPENNRLGLYGLFGLLALGMVSFAFLGFLAYLAWKNSQASTTPLQKTLTPEQIQKGREFLESLNAGTE